MFLFPDDIKSSIEFDKILNLLSGHCLGELAKSRAQSLSLFNNKSKIAGVLEEIVEYKQSIDESEELMLTDYEDIETDIFMLKKEGYVLDIEAIFRVHNVIRIIQELKIHFEPEEMSKKYPRLSTIVDQIELDVDLSAFVSQILEVDGTVKDNASPELARISKQILSKEKESNRAFDQVKQSLSSTGGLSENGEGYKNGRRVLSIKAEHKRKVKGIIHDESASGKTVFIEPETVVFLNNQVFELELRKKQEIYKIIKELCDRLRPYADDFALWLKIVIRLDLIRAKARFAREYNGQAPSLLDQPEIHLTKAYHPLLFLKNNTLGLKTVPFSLELSESNGNRILLISGPNAGGKSITLKSVALIQFMMQSGLLVPVDSSSRLGIFQKFFADIGDQQSLEDDLSTYSSRLKNMKTCLEKCNHKSLVLIDEFGSGTDPKIGGAIAEVFLDQLKKKKVFGVITTHYSNLKMYAHHNAGVVNGAMHFDKASLSPAYELLVGKPGSSFAFEIAEKIGLDPSILKKAKTKFGRQEKEVEALLADLIAEKKSIEGRKQELSEQQKQLNRLMQNYEEMKSSIDIQRKRMKLQHKEEKLIGLHESEKEVQRLIKEIRESQNLEKAKALSSELKNEQLQVSEQIEPLNTALYNHDKIDVSKFKVGDHVRLRNGGGIGVITKLSKKKAELEMGIMKYSVKLNDLLPADKPIDRNESKSVKMNLVHTHGATESKLDIRGYIPSDAEVFLVEFLDNALISNLNRLEIVHGVGSGTLMKITHRILKDYKDIKKVWHPEEEFGGKRITYVEF